MELSIILVNYNTKQLCQQTIASIIASTHNVNFEIIVIDNSCNEEERYNEQQPYTKIFAGIENKGFGNACNIGAKEASGEWLLFLNSDTILHDGALDTTMSYVKKHNKIGALGIRTLLEDESFDHGCKRGFPTPWRSLSYFMRLDRLFPNSKLFGGYRLTYLDTMETNEVDSVSGAFLLMPRQLFNQLGGFDERIFMYGEDLDLCYRVKEAGYKVVYFAEASMTHLKGKSGLTTGNPEVLRHFYNGMLVFYDKHYSKKHGRIQKYIVRQAIKMKYWLAKRNLREEK